MRFIKEIWRLWSLRLSEYTHWIKGIEKKKRSNAVISLSVLPSRFKGLKPTLNSLTDQSLLPEKIIINLPQNFERDQSEYDIPYFVEKHPLVEINWIEKDLGPATKLLPTLDLYKDEPDKLIIIVDDDQIYPQGMVENYVKNSEHLSDAAMTLSGWTVPKTFDHGDKVQRYGGIVRFYRVDNSVKEPEQVDCLQGAASFAVKPKLFDGRVFDFESAPREAFFVDDIWVSGNLAWSKSPVYVVPAPFRFGRFVSLRQSTQFGLSSTANSDNTNNNLLYKYFENDWWSLKQ